MGGTAASVSASKAATQLKVDALYAKMERNAIVIQQAREESLRSQTSNLEAKLELQRALASHQTEVQNRFQSKRFGVYKLNALKQDKLKQEFARSRFTINQLKTANGPTVGPLAVLSWLIVNRLLANSCLSLSCLSALSLYTPKRLLWKRFCTSVWWLASARWSSSLASRLDVCERRLSSRAC